jgi:CHAD domain-containing protein
MGEFEVEQIRADAVRVRAFEISQTVDTGSPGENWLQAERELGVAYDYDTADRDLEWLGMTLSRRPGEAGVVWLLTLPRGEQLEDWEPGNQGLIPPAAIARVVEAAAQGKPLQPAPPLSTDPGAVRLRELLENERRAMLIHDPGVRLGGDSENLHQHRVAARRTRAFLRAARTSLDPVWRRSMADRLRELGAATGPVRDLDVLVAHVEGELGSLDEADRPAGGLLMESLDRKRESARRRLLAAFDDDSYRSLLAQLRVPPRLADGVEAVPLGRIARKEFRRLVAGVEQLGKHPPEAAMHALRITLKRARYSAELAAPAGKTLRRFLADARGMQDLLGEYQDAVIAEQHLRAVSVSDAATAVAFVAGRIAERQRARRVRVRERLPGAWKRLRSSGARLG